MRDGQNKRYILGIILLSLVFVMGFLTAIMFNYLLNFGLEHPITALAIGEPHAPSDFVKEKNIEVYNDKIIIRLDNASLSDYASTGSMRPSLDKGANGIRIVPKSQEQINIGDIVTFERGAILIVHRVVEKGEDNLGSYFITKGDNNFYSDGKIRFSDIKYKTIGIIY